ncbi:MAG TPA: NAD+ synthase, partial [Candidatus Nanoarchaeia archaeon]|nr:NAD+ synthase [Candidatus Nanoarchaeia archaeon]
RNHCLSGYHAIIDKEPSAELRDNQKDSDSLPVYPVLDPILKAYVEDEKSKEEIMALGFEEITVSKVIKMVDRNEYKRQQAALGLRITPRAFGSGRRMPITNGWKE